MIEDEFRLTPADVRANELPRRLFGYDVAGVDDLRVRVAEEMERLLRERSALEERVNNYREQLKAFHEREKALNDAVVVAQQIREDSSRAVKRDSEVAMRAVRVRADEIVSEARKVEGRVRHDIEEAQRQFAGYLAAFRQLLWRHLAELDALADHERDGTPPRPK